VPKRLVFTPFDHLMGTDAGWQAMSGALLDGDFQIGQIAAFLDAEYLRLLLTAAGLLSVDLPRVRG